MTECAGKLVTDILEGLSLEKHQIDLLTRIGVIDHNDPEFDVNSLIGRLKCICDELGITNTRLDLLNSKDFSTETTLVLVKGVLDSVDTKLQSVIDEIQSFNLDFNTKVGEVSETPTENTVLDRLKKIKDCLDSLSDGTTNTDILNKLQDIFNELDAFALAFDNRDLATETTLEAARLLLVQIEENTDELELNTDELELKLDQLKASIEAFNTAFDNRDLATETTLLAFKDEAKVESDETQGIIGEVSATPTENTIQDRLKKIKDCLDDISDGTTNTDIVNKLQEILLEIDTFATAFDNRDLATETTLDALKSLTEDIRARVVIAFNGSEFTVHDQDTHDKLDALLNELELQHTDINAFKTAFDNRDLATSTKQDSQIAQIGEVSATPTANTVQDRLKSIYEAVDGLELSVDNIDLDMEQLEALVTATNQALASLEAANDVSGDDIVTAIEDCCNTLDATVQALQSSNEEHSDEVQVKIDAVKASVDSFKTAFDNRDLATETTLLAFKDEAKAESDETQGIIGEVSATPTVNTVMDRLKNIYEAVDGLELSVDNIDMNTDELENLVTATNQAIADLKAANDTSGDDIVTAIENCCIALSNKIDALQLSNETHSDEEQLKLDALKVSIDAFKSAFDNRDLATEAKQDINITELQNVNVKLADITAVEDVLSVDGQKGIAIMAVRNDNDAALTDADGDDSRIAVNEAGRVKTETQLTDDAGAVVNPATSDLQAELLTLAQAASAADGTTSISEFKTQFEYRYFNTDPSDVLKPNTLTGSSSQGNTADGYAFWRTGTTAGSVIDVETPEALVYSARHLSMYDGSFLWLSNPTGTGQIDAGAFTDLDGFMFRAIAGASQVVHRLNGSDNAVTLGAHNGDPLDGSSESKYTKDGVPVAVDFTKYQIGQIIGSWRGADTFQIFLLSPDKVFVLVHSFTYANEVQAPSLTNPNLPMRIRITNGNTSEALEVRSNCWSAATNVDRRVQIKSISNSTNVPLGVGEIFTGYWIPARFYPLISGSISASHDGRFRYEWSDDGTDTPNTYEVSDWFEYDAADGAVQMPQRRRRREFVRVKFENTYGVAQTDMHMSVYLEDVGEGVPTQLAKQNIGGADTVVPVKVYGDPNNPVNVIIDDTTPVNVEVTVNNAPVDETNPIHVEVVTTPLVPLDVDVVESGLTYDSASGNKTVGTTSTELIAADATSELREVQIVIPPTTANGVLQLHGVHLHFGAGAALATNTYFPVGTYTFTTNQRIAAKRAAAALVDVVVGVTSGVK